jgi:hypothetical protein
MVPLLAVAARPSKGSMTPGDGVVGDTPQAMKHSPCIMRLAPG